MTEAARRPLVTHVGPALPHIDAVEMGAWLDVSSVLSLQVEAVLGNVVTNIVKRCLSLMPQARPTMADIAQEMALSLYPNMV